MKQHTSKLNDNDNAVFTTTWEGIDIEITYNPSWSNTVEGLVHLQIRSVNPSGQKLPITETGYRSHFLYLQQTTIKEPSDSVAYVLEALNEQAQDRVWQEHLKQNGDSRQMALF